jgi:diguanylate cyclase (GGDEF)-like protein
MRSFTRNIFVGFGLATSIFFGIAWVITQNFARLENERHWVDESHEIVAELEGVVSDMKDVQSSQRGYVITGDAAYLYPLDIAQPMLKRRFARLHELLANHATLLAELGTLQEMSDARIAYAQSVIAAYRKDGAQRAIAMVRSGDGKRTMDEIRELVGSMIDQEQVRLGMRQRAVEKSTSNTMALTAASLAMGLAILAFVLRLILRETSKREATENTLNRALGDMRQRASIDKALGDLSDFLQSSNGMNEAYDLMSTLLPTIMPESRGSMALFNNSGNLLEQAVHWNQDSAPCEYAPEQCWAVRLGDSHFSVDGGTQPACTHGINTAQGTLCVPLQAQGIVIGVLSVERGPGKSDLRDDQLLAERVGKQLSLSITNLKLREKLRNQSVRDPLTGLFNRRYLEETLERELSRAERSQQSLSLLMLDIDHFKQFNDTRGHEAGDTLLVEFARVLRSQTRRGDAACRYGGEEFVVVLPGTGADIAEQLATRIRDATRAIRVSTTTGAPAASITVSIGVSTYPLHGPTQEVLLGLADEALYAAKHGGRDQVRMARIES